MTYVDQDGDTILENLQELKEWLPKCECRVCESDALEMLTFFNQNPEAKIIIGTHGFMFSTTCHH